MLVSTTAYDQAGRVYQTADPKGIITQTTYDNAGRTVQTVEDTAGLARTTSYAYTLDNQIAALTAVNAATGDQLTTYLYGTTLTESGVARNDLLRYTLYPDANEIWPSLTVDGWQSLTVADWATLQITSTDSVGYTYNALGQQTSITDQRGTVRSLYYDKLGRPTNDCVSTVGTGTDSTVLQIATTYEVRGMVQSVTSLNNATPGSGTVLNQTWNTYNTFGQLTKEQQEHSGTVTTGSVSVGYAYDSGASSSNEIRLNQLIYPNGRLIDYSYATGMDSTLNRVTAIVDDATSVTLASYNYLGVGTVVRITYPEPSVWLDLWGGTSGTFNGLDRFNRITDQRWQNAITTTPTDIDRYQYGYDQNSNRLWKANVVGTAAVGNLDEQYTYDSLNRLTDMKRGTLSGGTITGTPTVQQDWGLDPLGNWSTFTTAASGTTNLSQQRTANTVNEITAIAETTGPTWVTPAYDAAGNTTTMPQVTDPTQSFTAVYDAWNRMTGISASGSSMGAYTYDGRSRRIVKVTSSETRHFYWTNSWQDLEEHVGTATSMDKQYAWGIRYIDEMVCRDDATPQRLYSCQDGNFNQTLVASAAGAVLERDLYNPYGSRTIMTASWDVITTSDYAWDQAHQGLYQDDGTNLIYNRSRYYLLTLGVFLARDAAENLGSNNLYQYVLTDPITNLDPSGFLTVNIWHGSGAGAGKSWGHASITLDDGTYISWWPEYPHSPKLGDDDKRRKSIFSAPARKGTFALDTDPQLGEGRQPDERIKINCLNEKAIKEWWTGFRNDLANIWRSLGPNCSSIALTALDVGAQSSGNDTTYDVGADQNLLQIKDAPKVNDPQDVEAHAKRLADTCKHGHCFWYKVLFWL